MLRERLGVSKTIQLTETMIVAIQRAADTLGTSFAEVVRACVVSDLQKHKARKHVQKSRRTWHAV